MQQRLAQARTLMEGFAEATGLIGSDAAGVVQRRYLWTDAFAVCNFLELYRRTRVTRYRELAVALVEAVHHQLARHRSDDARFGWISGLDEAAGAARPLAGGLRIGKRLPERSPTRPYDERAEWDRDGQYFHYLTKWMHALARMHAVLGENSYAEQAAELARVTHRGFLRPPAPGQPAALAWKMSIDLSYPLVPFAGHHDPLDGLVTVLEVSVLGGGLDTEIDSLAKMCTGRDWATEDSLGIGGLLFDAGRLAQLLQSRHAERAGRLLEDVLTGAFDGLIAYARSSALAQPPGHRLAFRELGLSIGLHGLDRIIETPSLAPVVRNMAESLRRFVPLGETVERCWLQPRHRATPVWREHADINEVMLATSLLPDGFLLL